jgi:RIO-like serine/threonine protein kinase
MPPRTARDFILLEDLGYGADGRVWKAGTQQGEVCVLKFAHARPHETSKQRKARLQEECDNWKVVWGLEARVVPLVEDWALSLSQSMSHEPVQYQAFAFMWMRGRRSWGRKP